MAARHGDQRWLDFRADALGAPTPGAEATTARRIGRSWRVADENDARPVTFDERIRDRSCGQQRLRVGMRRSAVQLRHGSHLDDLAEIHDGDTMAEMAH